MANANTAEKLSEGVLEENNVNYCAILDAYNMSNEDLNLDLKVLVTDPVENLGDFVVTFDRHKSAFPKPQNKGGDSEPGEIDFAYPVDNYFLMFVKYDRSNIFSIANAEGIIQGKETNSEGKYRYVKIDPSFMPIMPENRFTEYLNFNNLVDTDGVPLEEGDNYVVFLLATLTNDYKKLINTYDDYLSAPSKSFSITTYLQAVDSKNIVVLGNTKDDSEIELVKLLDVNFEGTLLNQDIKGSLEVNDNEKITIKSGKLVFQNELTANLDVTINDKGSFDVEKSVTIGNDTEENLDSYEQVIVFAMPANADGETTKEYRCMFLPNNPETIKNLFLNIIYNWFMVIIRFVYGSRHLFFQ